MEAQYAAAYPLMEKAVEIAKFIGQTSQTIFKGVEPLVQNFEVDGSYGQTNNCLIYEETYGSPYGINTPMGTMKINNTNSARGEEDKLFRELLREQLGLVLMSPGYRLKRLGYYGPYYLITKFNGVEIPHPILPYQEISPREDLPQYYQQEEVDGPYRERFLVNYSAVYRKKFSPYDLPEAPKENIAQWWMSLQDPERDVQNGKLKEERTKLFLAGILDNIIPEPYDKEFIDRCTSDFLKCGLLHDSEYLIRKLALE